MGLSFQGADFAYAAAASRPNPFAPAQQAAVPQAKPLNFGDSLGQHALESLVREAQGGAQGFIGSKLFRRLCTHVMEGEWGVAAAILLENCGIAVTPEALKACVMREKRAMRAEEMLGGSYGKLLAVLDPSFEVSPPKELTAAEKAAKEEYEKALAWVKAWEPDRRLNQFL